MHARPEASLRLPIRSCAARRTPPRGRGKLHARNRSPRIYRSFAGDISKFIRASVARAGLDPPVLGKPVEETRPIERAIARIDRGGAARLPRLDACA
jgi:hypothetical protein